MKTNHLLLFASLPAISFAQDKPNIIVFLVDDMGWNETSVPFYKERTLLNARYHTPAMERLASLGTKFTNAYASPVSSPSRCSLLSGMSPARHRVTNWVSPRPNTDTNKRSELVDLPEWNWNGMQPDTTTLAADLDHSCLVTALPWILQQNGYYTIHCGKGNMGSGGTSGADPQTFGYDVNIAGSAAGAPASYLASDNYGSGLFHVGGLEQYYDKGTFLTEAITLEAKKAMLKPIADGKPFFLYFAHYAIHVPYDPDDRFTSHYAGVYDSLIGETLNEQEVNHAALIEGMDKSLGDVLDFLEKYPSVAKNTIILFMSDNGGQAVGSVRQGTLNRLQNYPARGGKGSAYDGGIHEPMMVYWPGITKGGSVNTNRVNIEDFFPTILDMAGVNNYKASQTIDGISFADLLRNPSLKRDRPIITHYPNIWGESRDRAEGYGATAGIMLGDYHLIYFWETQESRLYNITNDPTELTNLIDSEPAKAAELADKLTDELIRCDAQRPTLKSNGKLVPWPNGKP